MMLALDRYLRQLRVNLDDDPLRVYEVAAQAEDWAEEVMGANYAGTFPDAVQSAILLRAHGLYDSDTEKLNVADRLIDRWRDHTVA